MIYKDQDKQTRGICERKKEKKEQATVTEIECLCLNLWLSVW